MPRFSPRFTSPSRAVGKQFSGPVRSAVRGTPVSWAADLKDLNQKLDAKIWKADRKVGDGIKRATNYVKTGAGKRTFPTGARNVQDTTSRPEGSGRAMVGRKPVRTPVRSKFDSAKKAGIVSIKPYWANVRESRTKLSRVIQKLMAKFYSLDDLYRTNLKVTKGLRPGSRTLKSKGFRNLFETKQFRTHPDLLEWAQRIEKGYQVARHSIEMPSELRRELALQPAVDSNILNIRREIGTSVVEGLGG